MTLAKQLWINAIIDITTADVLQDRVASSLTRCSLCQKATEYIKSLEWHSILRIPPPRPDSPI